MFSVVNTTMATPADSKPEQKGKHLYLQAALLWLGLTLVWGLGVYSFWALEMRDIEDRLGTELSHHLELTTSHLEERLTQAQALLISLSHHGSILKILKHGPDALATDQVERTFSPIEDAVAGFRLLDAGGQERLRLFHDKGDGLKALPAAALRRRSHAICFMEASALPRGAVYVSPLSVADQAMAGISMKLPVLRLAMPTFDKDQRLGVMTLFLDGDDLYRPHDLSPLAGSVRELSIDPGYIYRIGTHAGQSWQAGPALQVIKSSPRADASQQSHLRRFGTVKPSAFLPLGEKQRSMLWQVTEFLDERNASGFYHTETFQAIFLFGLGALMLLAGVAMWARNRRNALRLVEQREQLMAELSVSRASLLALDAGVVIVDMQQQDQPIIDCNPAFEHITGYSRAEVLGRNCRFLQGDDCQLAERATIRDAIARQQSCHLTLRNYRKDGSMFYNDLHLSPVLNEDGELGYYIGIQHDVTESREAQRRSVRLQEEVHSLSQTLIRKRDERAMVWGQWLHDDIGQKLAATGAMAHVLERQTLDEQGQATLNNILNIIQGLMEDVRKRLNGLRPSYVEEIGLSDALRRRIEGWFLASRMRVDLHVDDELESLPDAQKRAVMDSFVDVQKRIEEACPLSQSLNVRCSMGGRLRLDIVLGGEWTPEAAENLAQSFSSGATYALLLERLHSHAGKLHVHASSMGTIAIALSWSVEQA